MKDTDGIRKLTEFMPSFKNEIKIIPLEDISNNEFNPRKKFGQEAEDELILSISQRGVLVPVIVYQIKRNEKTKFVLLDGQRRVQACRKLGKEEIPAHIIAEEPDILNNLSLMFHIHNVHEDWTDVAIAESLLLIIKKLRLNPIELSADDLKILKRMTSLSAYKIQKYKNLFHYSNEIIDMFKQSEMQEKPDLDLDLLSELRSPLKNLKFTFPSVYEKYSEKGIVEVFIQKKKNGIIDRNKELRRLNKVIRSAKNGNLRSEVVKEKIEDFLKNPERSIPDICSQTTEPLEQLKDIIKSSRKLREDLTNLDLRKLTSGEKMNLQAELYSLLKSLKGKMSGFDE